MPPCHPNRPKRLPQIWLMSDERMGDRLWSALALLPRGAGVVFRHLDTPLPERRLIFARIARIAVQRNLLLVRAGPHPMPGEMGVHGAGPMRPGAIRIWPAHSRSEAIAGARARADLLFVSPVFATRTHPGAASLGPLRAASIRIAGIPAIALGGMKPSRARRMKALGFHGWAAIDAWLTKVAGL